jgi:FlgD Ig-like domain
MKVYSLIYIASVLLLSSIGFVKPSFNGTTPGCSGGNCHNLQTGIVSLTPLTNLQIQVTVSGVQSGKRVAGELVDGNNNVVDVIDQTNTNPFILTAPQVGDYTVNAGFKDPSRQFGTANISLAPTGIQIPTPAHALTTFELYPNHPNPFNSETMIRFSLPKAARVELSVFNVHGQFIRHLTDDHYPAGIHSIRWNGRDDEGRPCPSGIYLCQIKSDDHRVVRSMILSK